jgi:hypothetical protein
VFDFFAFIFFDESLLSRCKMVTYLDKISQWEVSQSSLDDVCAPLLAFMKKLTPSAVDVELRALCQQFEPALVSAPGEAGDRDAVGVALLAALLTWFRCCLATATDFELLQAYLHRTLTVHGATIMHTSSLARLLKDVHEQHQKTCHQFRHLVQSNLCLLKLLTGASTA